MNDLFEEIKTLAIRKNTKNAKYMSPWLIFKSNKVIDNNFEKNEDTIINISNESDKDLIAYVDIVDKIKQEINKIHEISDEISNLKNKISIATTVEQENETSILLNMQIKNGNNIIQATKIDIRNVRKKFLLKSQDNIIIKKTIHDNLINVFKKALYKYQSVQNLYQNNVKDKISRHIKIMYPDYTEEYINNVLDNENVNTQNLVKWKLQGHDDLKNALMDVETKYKDVKTLEKNVCDLHQTIVELSALIEMNDDVINSVYNNIDDAQHFTEKANADLIDAKNIQKSSSKWMFYISVAIVVIIIIMFLPILVKII
ncbi:syntaxin, putative [Plasmodium berghei]|uniref:Syntaxin, putative n=2 Tax=Plasmodium berghei TaxID=5821 RepID=A0A509AF81_PLABA|nr:syntaxin, putative [Plasmodium berghei ANKA]CXH94233.1 syntaxin, putative [Plasmodium berghei]SCL90891.1 syntaxin, putative [Plasmodium berghei]SCM15376.1 syntaxin, putative [Plasmodium berghei]SCM17170.1 syntaxin, putative [Plasmodium berghei]SCN22197.1 syntaxin, putative [Plasmodium berghei]|eukprot:XP_034419960.1 syntaxin, putative [Plasmodium berghei ANKA]